MSLRLPAPIRASIFNSCGSRLGMEFLDNLLILCLIFHRGFPFELNVREAWVSDGQVCGYWGLRAFIICQVPAITPMVLMGSSP